MKANPINLNVAAFSSSSFEVYVFWANHWLFMHMLIVHSRRCACRDLSALSTCRRRVQPIIGPVSRGAGIAKYCLSRGTELAPN